MNAEAIRCSNISVLRLYGEMVPCLKCKKCASTVDQLKQKKLNVVAKCSFLSPKIDKRKQKCGVVGYLNWTNSVCQEENLLFFSDWWRKSHSKRESDQLMMCMYVTSCHWHVWGGGYFTFTANLKTCLDFFCLFLSRYNTFLWLFFSTFLLVYIVYFLLSL